MQKVTRLAWTVVLCHAAALVVASVLKVSRDAQQDAPAVTALHERADAILLANGYQRAKEPPLRSRFFQRYEAYRVPGCARAHRLFAEPLAENFPQYFEAQGLGAHVFRYYYEDKASGFPNGLVRQWTKYDLKLKHVLGMGPKPAGHFLLLAVPAECAGVAHVDLRPAYQRP